LGLTKLQGERCRRSWQGGLEDLPGAARVRCAVREVEPSRSRRCGC
jgi:hypothetical protein